MQTQQQEPNAETDQRPFVFVKRVFTKDTGGGCLVDFVELKTGQIIGLNDECVVLYPNMDAFYTGDDGDFDGFGMFYRPDVPTIVEKPRMGAYTDDIVSEETLDIVVLDTGEVLGVDSESVCLYANMDALFSAAPNCVLAKIPLVGEVPVVGGHYQSTDIDFQGTVEVTKVSDSLVHYKGDAVGYASIAQFFKQYRPVEMTGEGSAATNETVATAIVHELEIRKVLVLSTNHLTKHTCLDYKSWPFIADFEEGCYFYVGDNPESHTDAPEDLRGVLAFAKRHGCIEVKFDRDADPIPQLPRFEW